MRIASFVALAACLVAPAAHAITAYLEHPYGELVDVGETSVRITASAPHWFDCDATPQVRVTDRTVRVTIRGASYGPSPPSCAIERAATLGELAYGWWSFEFAVLEGARATVVDSRAIERKIGRPESMCGEYSAAYPGGTSQVIAQHRTLGGEAFLARYANDAAFRESLGHPVEVRPIVASFHVLLGYPGLENPHDLRARLLATGEFHGVWPNGLGCFSPPPGDAMAEVIEYYHAGIDHYFYTFNVAEVAILDAGERIRGWARTGEKFRVLAAPGCAMNVPERVAYRFYGTPSIGPSTHVFTVDREECRIVDRTRLWTYEGVAFWAVPIDARGGCADGTVPLYRLWRPVEVTNHRFTTRRSTVEAMQARGWVDEGTVMCLRAQ